MQLILLGGFLLSTRNAMLAPTAPRSLLSYRDLQAQGIHLTTMVVDGDEAIEFRHNKEGARWIWEWRE